MFSEPEPELKQPAFINFEESLGQC